MDQEVNIGRCRVCGCTDLRACTFQRGAQLFVCTWLDRDKTLCTNLECVASISLDVLVAMELNPEARL
jgi:hypothetical protein